MTNFDTFAPVSSVSHPFTDRYTVSEVLSDQSLWLEIRQTISLINSNGLLA